jgi:hypothetical protein
MTKAELIARIVKPLCYYDGCAFTPFGTSRVLTGQNVSYYGGVEFRHEDHLAAAKAAAEADYRARIAAALDLGPVLALVEASGHLGGWMSAALDDPKVCAEMKADINRWFAALARIGGRG